MAARSGHRRDLHRDTQCAACRAGFAHDLPWQGGAGRKAACHVRCRCRTHRKRSRQTKMLRDGRDVDTLPAGGRGRQEARRRRCDRHDKEDRCRALLSPRRRRWSRFFDRDLGGGAALDLGVYPVSLALHFFGRPLEISGRWQASKSGVDMRTEIDLQFEGGATARLSCGFDRDGANRFVIEGSEGVLRLEAPFLKAQRLIAIFAKSLCAGAKRQRHFVKIMSRLPLPGRRIEAFPSPATACSSKRRPSWKPSRRGASRKRDHAACRQRRGAAHHCGRARRQPTETICPIRMCFVAGRAGAACWRCSAPMRFR